MVRRNIFSISLILIVSVTVLLENGACWAETPNAETAPLSSVDAGATPGISKKKIKKSEKPLKRKAVREKEAEGGCKNVL